MKTLLTESTYIFTADYVKADGNPLGRWIELTANQPQELPDDIAAALLLEAGVKDVTPAAQTPTADATTPTA